MFRLKCWTKSLHYSTVYYIVLLSLVFLCAKLFLYYEVSSPNSSCSETSCLFKRSQSSITANLSEIVSEQPFDEELFDLFEFEYQDSGLFVNNKFKFPCKNVDSEKYRTQHGEYVIFANAIAADRTVSCYQSVTYATHADFRYLDNLQTISDRWNGPISLVMYTPGSDLENSIERIHFLRECGNTKIREWVTVHLFMDNKYITEGNNVTLTKIFSDEPLTNAENYNCSKKPEFGNHLNTFRTERLLYPVNIARNLARNTATTHYILSADIELYPNANLIPNFFKMLSRNQSLLVNSTKMVYVLPEFEIEYGNEIPEYKEDLVDFIKNGEIIPFHMYLCPYCHRMPGYKEWIQEEVKPSLNIFSMNKRLAPFHQWEPIYIGTNSEPFFDERLFYEGLRDRLVQAYAMCLLDYNYAVLDNAFLVHREGIRKIPHNMTSAIVAKQEKLIKNTVKTELLNKYGHENEDNCFLPVRNDNV